MGIFFPLFKYRSYLAVVAKLWLQPRREKVLERAETSAIKDGSFCDFQVNNYPLLVDRASNHPDLHSHASPRPPEVRVSSLCQGDLNVHLFSTIHAKRWYKTESIFFRRSKWQTKQHHCSTALLQVTFFHQPQIVYNQHCFSKSLPRIEFFVIESISSQHFDFIFCKGGGGVGCGYPLAGTIRKIVFDSTPNTCFRVSIRCRDGCRCCW